MRFGVIVISQDGNLFARTGSVSRHTAMLDPGDYNNNTTASYLDVSCLIAKTRKTAVFEVSLPAPLSGQNLIQAIRFELENNIPFPLEKVYWGFRKLSKDDRSYRIFAVLKSEVDSLYPKVKEAGLSCDYFIPSQLLQETLPDDSTDNVPAAKKESADLDDNPLQLFLSAISIDPSLKNIHLYFLESLYGIFLLLVLYIHVDVFLLQLYPPNILFGLLVFSLCLLLLLLMLLNYHVYQKLLQFSY